MVTSVILWFRRVELRLVIRLDGYHAVPSDAVGDLEVLRLG